MTLNELRAGLAAHPGAALRLVRHDGVPVPLQFHVTEVGCVTKRFIDCGGTIRVSEACVMQVWVAENDADHRLSAGKLGRVLALSSSLLPAGELPVEVEYQGDTIEMYTLVLGAVESREITFTLGRKVTTCLASDRCGVPDSVPAAPGCGCGPSGCR